MNFGLDSVGFLQKNIAKAVENAIHVFYLK